MAFREYMRWFGGLGLKPVVFGAERGPEGPLFHGCNQLIVDV
jgi:hypothetical protein